MIIDLIANSLRVSWGVTEVVFCWRAILLLLIILAFRSYDPTYPISAINIFYSIFDVCGGGFTITYIANVTKRILVYSSLQFV